MKSIRYACLPACLLIASVSATGSALAGEVYKCIENGSTVYQDQPCPGNPDQAPRQRYPSSFEGADNGIDTAAKPIAAPSLEDPNKKQVADLYASLHEAEQDQARIEQGYQADVAAAQARSNGNKMVADSEIKAINQRWNSQLQDLQQRQAVLAAQAQQLCPGSKEVTKDGKCK